MQRPRVPVVPGVRELVLDGVNARIMAPLSRDGRAQLLRFLGRTNTHLAGDRGHE